MKKLLLSIVLILLPLCMHAEADAIKDLLVNYKTIGGTTEVLDETGDYLRVSLGDSAFFELYLADNIIVVYTTCAPKCSSCARVYNKEWEFLFPLTPPFTSLFPLATMDKETGRIIWTDNDDWNYQAEN
ncbi:MAG: hypothetical protein II644_04905 [Paludibacteraceae bacterium]|nr:hypothetical protein [Paludibacteraceae bacterium]